MLTVDHRIAIYILEALGPQQQYIFPTFVCGMSRYCRQSEFKDGFTIYEHAKVGPEDEVSTKNSSYGPLRFVLRRIVVRMQYL